MPEAIIIKVKCGKTGLRSAPESKTFGAVRKVVNFIPLKEEEARGMTSEVCQPDPAVS